MSDFTQLQLPLNIEPIKEKRGGNWMRTISNVQFWPLDPKPEEILITDIAHAESMLCRFCGHVRQHYSVAQHSYYVSLFCDEPMKGLLHDASEAYLTDLPTPIKSADGMEEYRRAEHVLQSMIYLKYCKDSIETDNLRWADHQMLLLEKQSLKKQDTNWTDLPTIKMDIELWSPEEAKRMFLKRFVELGGVL